MNCNVHDIAYEIERIAEKIFRVSFDHSGTIFDRDFIEKESFYECMTLILYMHGNEKTVDFLNDIYKYKREDMNRIPNPIEIFERFKTCLVMPV